MKTLKRILKSVKKAVDFLMLILVWFLVFCIVSVEPEEKEGV